MMQKKAWVGAAILLVATIAFALGLHAQSTMESKKTVTQKTVIQKTVATTRSNTVGIYMESVQRQIDIRELQKRYPAESAQRINPAALRADSIVGWYDKGNSFHEQKMQNNLKSLGGIQILPEMLKGAALRGEIHQEAH
jgi:hypothetical protein